MKWKFWIEKNTAENWKFEFVKKNDKNWMKRERKRSVGNEKTVFLDSRIDKTWINLFSASQPHAFNIENSKDFLSQPRNDVSGKKRQPPKK